MKAYFSVSPSEDGLSKEDENNILNYIRRKEIRNVDSTAIFNAIYSNPGEEVKIADSQNEKILGQDIEIRVVNRGWRHGLLFCPVMEEKPTLKKAVELLHRKGIVFGIDESAIERMLNQEINYKEVPIAYGQPPKKGQDARIKYYIDFDHKAKPSILEDGTVDYKELNLVHNVTKGQVLADLIPATEGIPGKL